MIGDRPTALVALETERLRVQVQRALEAALISGELVPRDIYSAPFLAQKFGVSATPVREAMLALVRKGYVETVPNKGFRITEVSEADLDNIARIRQLIEVPIIADIATQLPRLDVVALGNTANLIEAAAAEGDLISYVEHDQSFHLALVRSLENPQLTELIADLRAHTRLFGLEHLAEQGELVSSAREHHELLRLLVAGSVDAAMNLMRVHISHTRGKWAGQVDRASGGRSSSASRESDARARGSSKRSKQAQSVGPQ